MTPCCKAKFVQCLCVFAAVYVSELNIQNISLSVRVKSKKEERDGETEGAAREGSKGFLSILLLLFA